MSGEMMRIALLVVYTVLSVAGMSLLKSAESVLSFKCIFGFSIYVFSFLIWIGAILRMMPMSQAFPLAAGALMLGTQMSGWFFLKERIGVQQMSGVLLILIGVVLVHTTASAKG